MSLQLYGKGWWIWSIFLQTIVRFPLCAIFDLIIRIIKLEELFLWLSAIKIVNSNKSSEETFKNGFNQQQNLFQIWIILWARRISKQMSGFLTWIFRRVEHLCECIENEISLQPWSSKNRSLRKTECLHVQSILPPYLKRTWPPSSML